MIFVFIGGQSASGKTGLSQHLLQKLVNSEISAQILNMDDYYLERPEGVDPEAFRANTNFDTPLMLDLDLFKEHLTELNKGHSIVKPLFAFKSNRREGKETIVPSEVVIIEGLFAQYFLKNYFPEDLASVSVNVTTESYLDIVDRRVKRDMAQRSRSEKEIKKHERRYVGPGFLKYTASSTFGTDVYVTNRHDDTSTGQDGILNAGADEIILKVKQKREEIASKNVMPRCPVPKVEEMVAKSHLKAGFLHASCQFKGLFFNGVFGNFNPNYKKEFTQEEINKSLLIDELKKYIDEVKQSNNVGYIWSDLIYKDLKMTSLYLAERFLKELSDNPEMSIQHIFGSVEIKEHQIIINQGLNKHPDFIMRDPRNEELYQIIHKAQKLDLQPEIRNSLR